MCCWGIPRDLRDHPVIAGLCFCIYLGCCLGLLIIVSIVVYILMPEKEWQPNPKPIPGDQPTWDRVKGLSNHTNVSKRTKKEHSSTGVHIMPDKLSTRVWRTYSAVTPKRSFGNSEQ